jgi:hypothetical protein
LEWPVPQQEIGFRGGDGFCLGSRRSSGGLSMLLSLVFLKNSRSGQIVMQCRAEGTDQRPSVFETTFLPAQDVESITQCWAGHAWQLQRPDQFWSDGLGIDVRQ